MIGSADGTGSAARFHSPYCVAVDGTGNIYVADTENQTIRKITPAQVVTTLAGGVGMVGSADGTGAAARFNFPNGVAVDSSGNLFVADSANHTLRKITPGGVVTTVGGLAGTAGSADGTGAAALCYVIGRGVEKVLDISQALVKCVLPFGVLQRGSSNGGNEGNLRRTCVSDVRRESC